MNEGHGDSLQISQFYKKAKTPLGLRPVLGRTGFSRVLQIPEPPKNILPLEVWGETEIRKVEQMSLNRQKKFFQEKIRHLPCLILTDGLSYPQDIKKKAREWRIALFATALSKRKSKAQLRKLFSSFMFSSDIISGGLLHIFGRGVLIMGDSGVGKSESALQHGRGDLHLCFEAEQAGRKACLRSENGCE